MLKSPAWTNDGVNVGVATGRPAIAFDRAKHRRAEAREFALMQALLFTMFLPIALVSRLVPVRLRPLASLGAGRQGVVAEARSAANVIAAFTLSR